MAWAVGLPLDTTKVRLIPGIIRANNTALEAALSSTTLIAGISYIPATHPMYFYSDTAPTGWTIVAAPADCLLALKGGASQYNVAGGATVGTWVGPNHALTLPELPTQVTKTFKTDVSYTIIGFPVGAGAGGNHHHDWTTTRPYAALGILAFKIA